MDDPLKRLIASFLDESGTLMDGYYGGQLSASGWHDAMDRLIVERHLATYFVGRQTRELTPDADRRLGERMQEQLDYLAGFRDSLEGMSEAQARARAALYAEALSGTWSRAKTWDWPLPVHPGDDCQGLTRCGCSWELDVQDIEELDADAYWRLGPTEHCDTCSQHARDYSPLRIRGGEV